MHCGRLSEFDNLRFRRKNADFLYNGFNGLWTKRLRRLTATIQCVC